MKYQDFSCSVKHPQNLKMSELGHRPHYTPILCEPLKNFFSFFHMRSPIPFMLIELRPRKQVDNAAPLKQTSCWRWYELEGMQLGTTYTYTCIVS